MNGLFLLGQPSDGDMKHKNNEINGGSENNRMLFEETKWEGLRSGIRQGREGILFS